MSYLFFAAAALAQAPLSPIPDPPAISPEAAPGEGSETVIGDPDHYERMTVPVTIEGQGPFRFMIDTGAQATVVTRRLSDRLALKPLGTATVVGMASSVLVDLVQVDGLEFAARTFDDIHAPLLDSRDVGADGILGLDSLQDLRVLIDFRDNTIAVDDADRLGGNRGYEIVVRARRKLGRLIIADADVDGVRTALIVDTGAQGSMGNLALFKRLRAKNRQEVTATDVHGNQITGALNLIHSLKIGRLQLSSMAAAFADAPAFAALGYSDRPALILGMREMRIFDRVAIDFSSRKVMFDLPASEAAGDGVNLRTSASRL